jgi:hypothetical protein
MTQVLSQNQQLEQLRKQEILDKQAEAEQRRLEIEAEK